MNEYRIIHKGLDRYVIVADETELEDLLDEHLYKNYKPKGLLDVITRKLGEPKDIARDEKGNITKIIYENHGFSVSQNMAKHGKTKLNKAIEKYFTEQAKKQK